MRCDTGESLKLHQLQGFQGDLKKRTKKDIDSLAASIKSEGLIMPFAVWLNSGGAHYLLDGHGRLAALTEIALSDEDVANQDFPVVYIKAETEDEAKKSLLQISSVYGKITREGAQAFMRTIPDYKAPSVARFVHTPLKPKDLKKKKLFSIIRIKVPSDKEEKVRALLNDVDYIEVVS